MSATSPQELCKQPAESRKFGMDFYNLLNAWAYIASIYSTGVETIAGGISDLVIQSGDIVNGLGTDTKVTVWIDGGTHGSKHRVEIQIISSDGEILEGDGILKVRDK